MCAVSTPVPLDPYALKLTIPRIQWRDRARHAMANNDHRSPRDAVPSGSPDPNIGAVIVGGNDETRLLLRGLLRLHRYRVLAEAPTAEELEPVDEPLGRRVLVLVADGDDDDWAAELVTARERQTGLLPLLIVPETQAELIARARAAGVLGILSLPFAIRDLISTVELVSRGEERYPAVPGQR